MDEARTILTTSNWRRAMQTIILVTRSDPRHGQRTILAPTSDNRRTLRNMFRVLNEAHRRLGGDPARSSADNDVDEPSGDDDNHDDYGEKDMIEEEAECGTGGMVDYGDAYGGGGGFGGVPAPAAAMADRIKKGKYHEMEGRGHDEGGAHGTTAAARCMICIEDFEARDDLGVMPCSHRFHQSCLVKWLARSCLCPSCRYALPSEEKGQRV